VNVVNKMKETNANHRNRIAPFSGASINVTDII
jgi:hypothetical protein